MAEEIGFYKNVSVLNVEIIQVIQFCLEMKKKIIISVNDYMPVQIVKDLLRQAL